MGVASGPNLAKNNMILNVDVANRQCYLKNSILPLTAWTTGSGGISYFGQNGGTEENERVYATDPWNNSSIVWETRPTGTTDADGGWNTSWFNIDRTQLYRFSVWMRRTSSTAGGTFYFGLYGNGGTFGVARLDNGATEGNSYWECAGTGTYTQNQWYLYVGHCYPYGTTYTGRHPDSGYYLPDGTKYNWGGCNVGNDVKWLADSTQTLHRTYHYYCSDNTTRLQFYAPRIDLCDGSEMTIKELLDHGPDMIRDISTNKRIVDMSLIFNSNYVTVDNQPVLETNDTTGQMLKVLNYTRPGTSRTYSIWIKSKSFGIGWQTWFDDGSERILFGTSTNTVAVYPDLNFTANLQTNQWYNLAYTLSGTSCIAYVNGLSIGSGTYASALTSGTDALYILGDSGTEVTSCYFSCATVYDRVLSPDEIYQNFVAMRSRFGI